MKSHPSAPPTIRRVAELAGVSVGTVSRVVNSKGNVAPDIRARVVDAVAALGYKPNLAAQTMRSQVSRIVACVIRDISIGGFAQFVRAADEVLTTAGYTLMLCNSEARITRERELLSTIAARRADALLIAQSSEDDESFGHELRKLSIPVVMIDRAKPAWADAVMLDHRTGTRQVTTKLLELGHRRIALLTGHPSLYPAYARLRGYEEAFSKSGLKVDRRLVRTGGFDLKFGFEQASMLLHSESRPTAIIAGGIDMLPGVVRALRAHGLSVPSDVSIVGALNSDLAELHQPPISVEDWDYSEVGRIAANLALHRIAKGSEAEPRRVLVPTRFLLRDSCASLPHLAKKTAKRRR